MAEVAAVEAAEAAETPQLERLILPQPALTPPDDDTDSGAPCYADVALAEPALAEIAASVQQATPETAPEVFTGDLTLVERSATPETLQDAVNAELAAIFREQPVPDHVHAALTA